MTARKPDLATELTDLPERRTRFAWAGHEYVRGWGIFGLPFDTGHVLARVFPHDFAPYRTVWRRTPDGSWSIFVDGPRLDTACLCYYGPACAVVAHTEIDLRWTGPTSLRVTMAEPALDWTVEVSACCARSTSSARTCRCGPGSELPRCGRASSWPSGCSAWERSACVASRPPATSAH